MNGNQGGKLRTVSDTGGGANELSPPGVGQNCPQDYPHPEHKPKRRNSTDPLGEALSIAEVAEVLGCSVWTVRKKCLPRGLPHFRIGTTGKLVFYRAQVTRWILEQQERYRGRR